MRGGEQVLGGLQRFLRRRHGGGADLAPVALNVLSWLDAPGGADFAEQAVVPPAVFVHELAYGTQLAIEAHLDRPAFAGSRQCRSCILAILDPPLIRWFLPGLKTRGV